MNRRAIIKRISFLSVGGAFLVTCFLAKRPQLCRSATIDIAADVPPVTNIWKFNDMGYSFVAISGGKALRGPQSAGILMVP